MCYPVSDTAWAILSSDGDFYVEEVADWITAMLLSGRSAYPESVDQVVAFESPLDTATILEWIQKGRKMARRLPSEGGGAHTHRSPKRGVDYWGAPLELPAESGTNNLMERLS